MKRTFLCTKESLLYLQIADKEKQLITEIINKGYPGGNDLMMLSDMSKYGSWFLLDIYNVTELNTDDLEEDGAMDCYPFLLFSLFGYFRQNSL